MQKIYKEARYYVVEWVFTIRNMPCCPVWLQTRGQLTICPTCYRAANVVTSEEANKMPLSNLVLKKRVYCTRLCFKSASLYDLGYSIKTTRKRDTLWYSLGITRFGSRRASKNYK
jgi:hypothetical protein